MFRSRFLSIVRCSTLLLSCTSPAFADESPLGDVAAGLQSPSGQPHGPNEAGVAELRAVHVALAREELALTRALARARVHFEAYADKLQTRTAAAGKDAFERLQQAERELSEAVDVSTKVQRDAEFIITNTPALPTKETAARDASKRGTAKQAGADAARREVVQPARAARRALGKLTSIKRKLANAQTQVQAMRAVLQTTAVAGGEGLLMLPSSGDLGDGS